jgi:parvulin-like peptidyl-prolyl isomerase
MRTILKEPLLHFVVIGALLFAAYSWRQRGTAADAANSSRVVRITANEVEWLQQTWARQWQRPPTDEEIKGLVADYLKEELLSREARELQLDAGDTVVRRRLAQKMSFLVEDTARATEPSEDELQRLFEASRGRFQLPARVSFTHVFFSREGRNGKAADAAKQALARLSGPDARVDAAESGDRFLLGHDFILEDEQSVASQFGADFARAVFAVQPGRWHGPIESGYGLHLVRVSAKQPAQLRAFADVREQVLEEWRREQQKTAEEQYMAAPTGCAGRPNCPVRCPGLMDGCPLGAEEHEARTAGVSEAINRAILYG